MTMKHNSSTFRRLCMASCAAVGLWPLAAHAQDASLTPFGAEKAGSADGVIPAYTGGIAAMTTLPTGAAAEKLADPFAGEKPLYSITAANVSQYAGKLTAGAQALLKRYPEYRIDVYPTHRTASYPDFVLQNDIKNVSTAKSVGAAGVTGAYGGNPFQKPTTGDEVMWNSLLSYVPAYCNETFQNYLVDSSGAVTFLGDLDSEWVEPYYDPKANALPGKFWRYYLDTFITPAASAGSADLFYYPIDFNASDDVTYDYTPGTRRVRLAPQFKYDTPIAVYGGAIDFDEIDLFYGALDKFDFKLVGKKDMIVPYNDYKFANTTQDDVLGRHTLKPDGVRWEMHRVWVVEGTLKAGERHSYARWNFYVDEDSWKFAASESYDHAGAIYRVGFTYPYQSYIDGPTAAFTHTFGIYDLSKGSYEISYVHTANASGRYTCKTTMPSMRLFSPQGMLRNVH